MRQGNTLFTHILIFIFLSYKCTLFKTLKLSSKTEIDFSLLEK